MNQNFSSRYAPWLYVTLAFGVIMVCMGTRLTVGLFVQPLMDSKGLNIVQVSTAMAIGQLSWGLFQPLFGAWADKGHAFAALCAGLLFIALGQMLTITAQSSGALILAQGILSPAGVAAGSFAVLIGVVSTRLAPDIRSTASGIINAGGSAGQFLYAHLIHAITSAHGYEASLAALAGAALLAILPAFILCRLCGEKNPKRENSPREELPPELARPDLGSQLKVALRTPSYFLLHAGFFTCGFHVAFLATHLPGEISLGGHSAAVSATSISLIGLCNVLGSIGAGILGNHMRHKFILTFIYAARAVIIGLFLLAPKTAATFYLFSCTIGLTWLATVPPTAGVVNTLFGKRYLATLFGLTFLTHQVGGFLGAWLGGLAMQNAGNLLWIWYADMILAFAAALINLPIKEAPRTPPASAAASSAR